MSFMLILFIICDFTFMTFVMVLIDVFMETVYLAVLLFLVNWF